MSLRDALKIPASQITDESVYRSVATCCAPSPWPPR